MQTVSQRATPNSKEFHVAILGGGLAGLLCARALSCWHPSVKWVIYEKAAQLGGSHTWSFHESDLTPSQFDLLKPFVSYQWPGYDVVFPKYKKRFEGAYYSMLSTQMHEYFMSNHAHQVVLSSEVGSIRGDSIYMRDMSVHKADLIIDTRGLSLNREKDSGLAYQKFLGLEIEIDQPHGLTAPILMDATVEQTDGYRFIYTLPFSERHLLIEDTYFSLDPRLNLSQYEVDLNAYAERMGWTIKSIVRKEHGILPLPLNEKFYESLLPADSGSAPEHPDSTNPADPVDSANAVITLGMRSGLFHSTTGYSLPDLMRSLDVLKPSLDSHDIEMRMAKRRNEWVKQNRFFQMLNRLLYYTLPQGRQYLIMQGFYRGSASVIKNFYRGELSFYDKVKIFSMRPPVPLHKAYSCLREIPHARA